MDDALLELTHTAVETAHRLVDDELERAGLQVKYYDGPLYRADYSKLRQCIVIAPADADLPAVENWKERDSWNKASYDYPVAMRHAAALEAANQRQADTNYQIYDCTSGDFSRLPPLPDPGPEPAWHQKDLKRPFNQLRITDENLMEELAQLEHVTRTYLQELYKNDAERHHSTEELIALIREGRAFPPREAVPHFDDSDEDEDDEYDDDDF